MKKALIFTFLFLLSRLVCACGSDAQHKNMAERLYADADMQKFVCGSDSCSLEEFEGGLQFQQYDEKYHGDVISVCLVEPNLSAVNSYTGVFAGARGDFKFQLISYGAGIKVGVDRRGVPMLSEYSVSDPDNWDNSVNQYLWRGSRFIFVRNVNLSK